MNLQEEPIDLRKFRIVYFDTSAWDYLSKHKDRDRIVHVIKGSRTVVLASVISAAEVLRTPDAERRRTTCAVMRELHSQGPLLEGPIELPLRAAEAFIRGEKDITLPRTGSGKTIYSHILDPSSPPDDSIWAWLNNMDDNLDRFIEQIKPTQPDVSTRYCMPSVLDRDDFSRVMCDLLRAMCEGSQKSPLSLSISQMKELIRESDIWRALASTLACIIELSTAHAPKSRRGRRRPGGPDLWQAVYVGVSEVFVTGDRGLLQAATRVSSCLKYPRCVVSREDFISGALCHGGKACWTPTGWVDSCRVCGCILPTHAGMHAPPKIT